MANSKDLTVKIGDTIGLVQKVMWDNQGKENYWKLTEGKVKSITENSKGRRVKADHFYTLSANEVEENTAWMLENEGIIITCEAFVMTDELRQRVQNWIDKINREREPA